MKKSTNPVLADLEFLIGDWIMELSNASFLSSPSDTFTGTAKFELIEGGDYLAFRQGEKGNGLPHSTCIISRDEKLDEDYTALYFDDRAVSRIYKMSFENNEWRQWRDELGFYQRFIGKISKDGKTINAKWQSSKDGKTWQHDFDLKYTKK